MPRVAYLFSNSNINDFFGFCAEPGAAVGSKGTVRIVVWVCCFCLHA